jgi:hypothetical protein
MDTELLIPGSVATVNVPGAASKVVMWMSGNLKEIVLSLETELPDVAKKRAKAFTIILRG